jgi:hypothetical protein
MRKQRNIRKRRAVDDDDEIPSGQEEEDTQKPLLTADDIRLLQKQRQRKTVSSHLWLPFPSFICPPISSFISHLAVIFRLFLHN